MGWIDSHANIPGGQGQDFTFNILTAAGVSYSVNESWKIDIGVLYQHLSNGGQTDPNPSLNLIGPQIGVTYSFCLLLCLGILDRKRILRRNVPHVQIFRSE